MSNRTADRIAAISTLLEIARTEDSSVKTAALSALRSGQSYKGRARLLVVESLLTLLVLTLTGLIYLLAAGYPQQSVITVFATFAVLLTALIALFATIGEH